MTVHSFFGESWIGIVHIKKKNYFFQSFSSPRKTFKFDLDKTGILKKVNKM